MTWLLFETGRLILYDSVLESISFFSFLSRQTLLVEQGANVHPSRMSQLVFEAG